VEALIAKMLPLSTLITPNTLEAETLSGVKVTDEKTAKKAALEILELGPKAVLVKGGHLKGTDSADYLCVDGRFKKVSSPRIDADVHGTGCALASLIAGGMANGEELEHAVESAKSIIYKAILARDRVGLGVPCANPLALVRIEAGKVTILEELEKAALVIESILDARFIPEVGTNMGYSVLGATGTEEVAAFDGRIVRCGTRAKKIGCARFGASKHVARIVLAAASRDPEIRCALNIKYSKENLKACRSAGLSVAGFDRAEEPKGVSSMSWGVAEAIDAKGAVVDVIFDEGGMGKEPMIRIVGKSPEDVASKLRRVVSSR
jgi:hydroxymethylpyrimidine/phosphomethylpyrimidine kinase